MRSSQSSWKETAERTCAYARGHRHPNSPPCCPKLSREELGVDENDLEKSFALRALGGTESDGYVYFNFWSSGPAADGWQVLSPVKGEAAGTLILNRLIQSGFRPNAQARAAAGPSLCQSRGADGQRRNHLR